MFADAKDRGFDAIIGNPPFLGGQKLSRALGTEYLFWLQRWDGNGVKGSADLAARFVLRANRLLNSRGQLGFITTNTLVQGDTLTVGLGQATADGLTVRAGRGSHAWPSASANLEIVNVWASRARLAPSSQRLLDGEDVPSIGADLEPVGRVSGRPYALMENEGIAFKGVLPLGQGFVMSAEQAQSLIARDASNMDILRPYLIGQDVNQRPDHSASRYIIDFQDFSLAKAEAYPGLLDIVRLLVKPERERNKESQTRDYWWQFSRRRPELYRAINHLERVIVMGQTSSTVMPVLVSSRQVMDQKTVVFASRERSLLSFLSSSSHLAWTLRFAGTMRADISYAPSDVFLTLPRPRTTHSLVELGERLDTRRRELMLSRAWGLTTTYNAVHSPAVSDSEVVELREIHEAIDHAVLDAYGWGDLDPQVGHHPTKIGTRWTVSREARFELLDRLLEENHKRHAAEQAGTSG